MHLMHIPSISFTPNILMEGTDGIGENFQAITPNFSVNHATMPLLTITPSRPIFFAITPLRPKKIANLAITPSPKLP